MPQATSDVAGAAGGNELEPALAAEGKKQAHEMLAEIYGWFPEEFDMNDLQEAKTLLEELTEVDNRH